MSGFALGQGFGPHHRSAVGVAGAPPTPAVFTMTQLANANRVYQRATTSGGGQGKGRGSIPIAIIVTTPGTIHARCRSAADGTTILQGPWLATASAATGTLAVNGIDARQGWFYLDLSGDGTTWQNGTTPVAMGLLMLMSGQSLMDRIFRKYTDITTLAGTGVSVPADGRVFAVADSADGTIATSWLQPADAGPHTGAGCAELMSLLIAASGVSIGLVGKSQGATSITQWLSGQTYGNALLTTMDAAGGAFEIIWWYQGHNDSNTGMAPVTYKGHLDTLFAGIAAHNSFAEPTVLISAIPNIASTSWGTTIAKEIIRRAAHDWAIAKGYIPLVFADLEMIADGIHQTQAGSRRNARHAYRALRPLFGLAHDDKGATLGTPAHASGSRDVVIPFTLPTGASALAATGTPGSRFKIYKYGDRTAALALDATTPFALDNVAHTITLKLASDPGQIPLEVLPYGANDPANDGSASGLYDDLADGDGIAQGRPLSASPLPARLLVNRDLAITGGAYGTGRFGTTLTAGYGVTAQPTMFGAVTGGTLEAWVRLDSTSASLRVFCGQPSSTAGSGTAWIGCQNNDLKLAMGNSPTQTYAGALPTGQWVHVAIVVQPYATSATAYVNGIAKTPISCANWEVTTSYFGVRRFGNLTTFDLVAGQLVDEIALFETQRYASGFTPPAAGYRAGEPGLLALWHLDGDGVNAV